LEKDGLVAIRAAPIIRGRGEWVCGRPRAVAHPLPRQAEQRPLARLTRLFLPSLVLEYVPFVQGTAESRSDLRDTPIIYHRMDRSARSTFTLIARDGSSHRAVNLVFAKPKSGFSFITVSGGVTRISREGQK
jgi:hypothetical protein